MIEVRPSEYGATNFCEVCGSKLKEARRNLWAARYDRFTGEASYPYAKVCDQWQANSAHIFVYIYRKEEPSV